jgi:hypothetical protein
MSLRGPFIGLSRRADALPHRLAVMVVVPKPPQAASPPSTEQTDGAEDAQVSDDVWLAVLPSS